MSTFAGARPSLTPQESYDFQQRGNNQPLGGMTHPKGLGLAFSANELDLNFDPSIDAFDFGIDALDGMSTSNDASPGSSTRNNGYMDGADPSRDDMLYINEWQPSQPQPQLQMQTSPQQCVRQASSQLHSQRTSVASVPSSVGSSCASRPYLDSRSSIMSESLPSSVPTNSLGMAIHSDSITRGPSPENGRSRIGGLSRITKKASKSSLRVRKPKVSPPDTQSQWLAMPAAAEAAVSAHGPHQVIINGPAECSTSAACAATATASAARSASRGDWSTFGTSNHNNSHTCTSQPQTNLGGMIQPPLQLPTQTPSSKSNSMSRPQHNSMAAAAATAAAIAAGTPVRPPAQSSPSTIVLPSTGPQRTGNLRPLVQPSPTPAMRMNSSMQMTAAASASSPAKGVFIQETRRRERRKNKIIPEMSLAMSSFSVNTPLGPERVWRASSQPEQSSQRGLYGEQQQQQQHQHLQQHLQQQQQPLPQQQQFRKQTPPVMPKAANGPSRWSVPANMNVARPDVTQVALGAAQAAHAQMFYNPNLEHPLGVERLSSSESMNMAAQQVPVLDMNSNNWDPLSNDTMDSFQSPVYMNPPSNSRMPWSTAPQQQHNTAPPAPLPPSAHAPAPVSEQQEHVRRVQHPVQVPQRQPRSLIQQMPSAPHVLPLPDDRWSMLNSTDFTQPKQSDFKTPTPPPIPTVSTTPLATLTAKSDLDELKFDWAANGLVLEDPQWDMMDFLRTEPELESNF